VWEKCTSSVTYSAAIIVGEFRYHAGDFEIQENIFYDTACEAKSKFRDFNCRKHVRESTATALARP
jgi:hypothetical protein